MRYNTTDSAANVPPPAWGDFVAEDTGNANPRFLRATLGQLGWTPLTSGPIHFRYDNDFGTAVPVGQSAGRPWQQPAARQPIRPNARPNGKAGANTSAARHALGWIPAPNAVVRRPSFSP